MPLVERDEAANTVDLRLDGPPVGLARGFTQCGQATVAKELRGDQRKHEVIVRYVPTMAVG